MGRASKSVVGESDKSAKSLVPKCPKCKNYPTALNELWRDHTIQFNVDSDGQIAEEGNFFEGYEYKVVASCACGHAWTLKKVRDVASLRKV